MRHAGLLTSGPIDTNRGSAENWVSWQVELMPSMTTKPSLGAGKVLDSTTYQRSPVTKTLLLQYPLSHTCFHNPRARYASSNPSYTQARSLTRPT